MKTYLEPDEISKIEREVTNLRDKLLVRVLFHLGCRISEALAIKVEDIDFFNQRIILKVTKRRGDKSGSKKSHTRTIRVSKEMIRDIKRRISNLNLQSNDTLKLLSTSGANVALKGSLKYPGGILKKINIKDYYMFSIHNIRKTAETWALALGIDSMVLSKRFGHNLITAYQHYSQSDAYTYKEKDDIKKS